MCSGPLVSTSAQDPKTCESQVFCERSAKYESTSSVWLKQRWTSISRGYCTKTYMQVDSMRSCCFRKTCHRLKDLTLNAARENAASLSEKLLKSNYQKFSAHSCFDEDGTSTNMRPSFNIVMIWFYMIIHHVSFLPGQSLTCSLYWVARLGPEAQGPVLHAPELWCSSTQQHSLCQCERVDERRNTKETRSVHDFSGLYNHSQHSKHFELITPDSLGSSMKQQLDARWCQNQSTWHCGQLGSELSWHCFSRWPARTPTESSSWDLPQPNHTVDRPFGTNLAFHNFHIQSFR